MADAADLEALTDPVCGKAVAIGSAFRLIHAGALFCFCSVPCREQFAADAERFLRAALPGERSTVAAAPPPEPLPGPVAPAADAAPVSPTTGPITVPTFDGWTVPFTVPAAAVSGAAEAASLSLRPAPGTAHESAFAFLVPMQQRRFARRVSRELLALYDAERARNARVQGRDLYREVVSARMLVDVVGAEALLVQAEESFAAWPTERPLTFVDVVHMIVILEFRARYGGAPWIRANLGHVVAEQIPHQY